MSLTSIDLRAASELPASDLPEPGGPGSDGSESDVMAAVRTLPPATGPGDPIPLELWLMHVRFARTADPTVLADLVEHYGGYAANLARRFHRDVEAIEDLVQVAMEALLRAIQRFDPERGIPFTAFATPTIVGSLKTHYRDLGWSIHVARRVHELAAPIRQTRERLTAELGRSPRITEVATALGVAEEEVIEAQEAAGARTPTSLDALVDQSGSRFEPFCAVDPDLARTEHHVMLSEALGHLTPLESHLLRLYFVDDMSQSQMARRLGISQMQVSRRLNRTLEYLRSRMMDD